MVLGPVRHALHHQPKNAHDVPYVYRYPSQATRSGWQQPLMARSSPVTPKMMAMQVRCAMLVCLLGKHSKAFTACHQGTA